VIGRALHPLLTRLPAQRRARLRRLAQPAYLGALRRTQPLSERYGYDRGQPVDRYYIEAFLSSHRADIRGRGLEIKSPVYLRRYDSGLTQCDALDIDPSNRDATVIADLSAADNVADRQFDVFILTQTLQFIFDLDAAIRHAHRILRPGGVLLATIPSVSRTDRALHDIDYWRLTPAGCARLFGKVFGDENVQVTSYGNVLAATAFLMGLAVEDLRQSELDHCDPAFPVLAGVWALRA
jgi:SAM-dependent methyltransferase